MNPLRGIALKVVSIFFFITMMICLKATSDTIPAGEAVFFRSFFALPSILIWIWWIGELRQAPKTANPFAHIHRAAVGTIAMGFNFGALAFLPLPEVTAIGYAAPLLTVIFAAILLKEKVRAIRIACVLLGLTGVLIILWPRLSFGASSDAGAMQAIGAGMVVISAVFAALAQVQIRKMVQTERTSSVVFYFTTISTVLALFTLPWGWAMPTPSEAMLLILAGLCGGVGQILLTESYRWADASLVAPFEYGSMVLALAAGYVFFQDVPNGWMLIGGALVMLAGILLILRESQLGSKRARQRKAGPSSPA